MTKLWTRDFSLLFVSTLLLSLSFYFLLAALPLFVGQQLGGDGADVGAVTGMFALTSVAVRPLSGCLLDRWGRRGLHLASLLLFALLAPAYRWAGSLALLFAVRLLHGVAWGVTNTAAQTTATDMVPEARRGEGLGYFGLTMTLAMALGPLLALAVLGGDRFGLLFTLTAALALVAALLALPVRHPRVEFPCARIAWRDFFEPRVLWVALVAGTMSLSYGGIVTFVTVYAGEIGIANPGIFFSAYAVAMVAARAAGGRVFDRRGPALIAGMGFVLTGAGFAALALLPSTAGFVLAAVLLGLGYGIDTPILQAMAVNLVPVGRRGVANATLFMAFDSGIGLGSYLLGLVAGASSYTGMYLLSGLTLLLPLALFYIRAMPQYRSVTSGQRQYPQS